MSLDLESQLPLSYMRLIPNPPGKISDGEIIFHQSEDTKIDLLSISEEKMRAYRGNDIAMIFQEPMTSLNPVFTCGDQVVEAIILHQKVSKKEAKEITIKLFEEVQLPDPERIYSTYPHQISGGQKQRVMINYELSTIYLNGRTNNTLDVTVKKPSWSYLKVTKREQGILFITRFRSNY